MEQHCGRARILRALRRDCERQRSANAALRKQAGLPARPEWARSSCQRADNAARLRLREATAADAARCTAVINHAYEPEQRLTKVEGVQRTTLATVQSLIDREGGVVLCVTADGAIVAAANLQAGSVEAGGVVFPAAGAGARGAAAPLYTLGMLAVDPAWRGRGIAGMLLRESERRARRGGASELHLSVVSTSAGRLLPAYARRGYVAVGRHGWPDALQRRAGFLSAAGQRAYFIDMLKPLGQGGAGPGGGGGSGEAPCIEHAVACDAPQLASVVNAAYRIELGVAGLAFKSADRYPCGCAEARAAVEAAARQPARSAFLVARARLAAGGARVCGCVRVALVPAAGGREGRAPGVVQHVPPRAEIGPLAVAPAAQGRGVGRALLHRAEAWARAVGCAALLADVVNHRVDLFEPRAGAGAAGGWYARCGFARVGTAPCDAAHNCAAEQLTRPAHFHVLEKRLL
eukprot:g4456.t1